MTIDDRLDALTQTVELLAGMQLQNEKRIAENEERMNRMFTETNRMFTEMNREIRAGFGTVRQTFEIVLDSIRGLENIARSHDQRLDRLEE